MKCNTPKPPKMPKSWDQLRDYDRQIILKVLDETADDRADKKLADTQEVWIKMGCIILDEMGRTEEELLQFIAAWKRMYRRNARLKNKEEQDAWLDRELARCFQETGFPQFRIDEMKEM